MSDKEVKVVSESQVETVTEVSTSVTSVREVPQIVRDLAAKPEHIQLVDALYDSLKKTIEDIVKDEGISSGNIIVIIDTAMKLVGKLKSLDGVEKKALVITVVKRLIDESDLKEQDAAVVKIIAERALSPAIDQLFAMAPEVYGKVKTSCLKFCRN